MPVTRSMLERLVVPLNRGDFPAFIEAVERLPAADRNVLAVLGAGELLRTVQNGELLRQRTWGDPLSWLARFQNANLEARTVDPQHRHPARPGRLAGARGVPATAKMRPSRQRDLHWAT